ATVEDESVGAAFHKARESAGSEGASRVLGVERAVVPRHFRRDLVSGKGLASDRAESGPVADVLRRSPLDPDWARGPAWGRAELGAVVRPRFHRDRDSGRGPGLVKAAPEAASPIDLAPARDPACQTSLRTMLEIASVISTQATSTRAISTISTSAMPA